MPPLIKKCVHSWEAYNPDWDLRLLDVTTIHKYFDEESVPPSITPQAFSDILRINLLSDHGGVWADADVWCCKPLNSWIHKSNPKGFFAYNLPNTKRTISSWFLASSKENYLTIQYRSHVREYWSGRKHPHAYYWFHYLFKPMCEEDSNAQDIWGSCKKRSAWGCLSFRGSGKGRTPSNSPATLAIQQKLRDKKEEMYKLSWRVKPHHPDSILNFLESLVPHE